jgi:hypothetical protein
MKNIKYVNETQNCYSCKLKGFFCYTPSGGDFNTCPCCGNFDFISICDNSKTITEYDFLYEDEYENDMRNIYKYCEKCKIIFELGCEHYRGGCTDNTYNCHFIEIWKDITTNVEYQGMPQFENVNDWFCNVNNVEVLKMYCPHKGNKCASGLGYNIPYTCNLLNT